MYLSAFRCGPRHDLGMHDGRVAFTLVHFLHYIVGPSKPKIFTFAACRREQSWYLPCHRVIATEHGVDVGLACKIDSSAPSFAAIEVLACCGPFQPLSGRRRYEIFRTIPRLVSARCRAVNVFASPDLLAKY